MNMTLLLDSIDYSYLLPKKGYSVSYKKVLGPNSRTTLDGKYHEDILAYKAIVKVDLTPMTSEQISKLAESVQNCRIATFYDTKTNSEATREVYATLEGATLVFNTANKAYWSASNKKGITLTLEER